MGVRQSPRPEVASCGDLLGLKRALCVRYSPINMAAACSASASSVYGWLDDFCMNWVGLTVPLLAPPGMAFLAAGVITAPGACVPS